MPECDYCYFTGSEIDTAAHIDSVHKDDKGNLIQSTIVDKTISEIEVDRATIIIDAKNRLISMEWSDMTTVERKVVLGLELTDVEIDELSTA